MIQVDQSTRFKNIVIMTALVVVMLVTMYFLSHPNFFGLDFRLFKKNIENTQGVVLSVEEHSVFKEISKPIYGFPKKIKIESIEVNADIISVSVDNSGHLEAPKEWDVVGWYKGGARPSEEGNLVLNAHYDDSYGRPAVFWKLKNVGVGDKVSVLDNYGRWFDYRVVDVHYVDINDPDRTKIFDSGEDKGSIMTLITCGGVWSVQSGTYDKRLVVSAELIHGENE